MRRLLSITLLLTASAFAQVTQIDVQKGHTPGGTNTLTMPALNTSGASGIYCASSTYEGFSIPTDSCGNKWQHGALQSITTGIWFVSNPVSCASDTITVTATYGAGFPAAVCMSFSGTTTTYPYAVQTPYQCWPETSPFQCGAVSAIEAGDLILSVFGEGQDQTFTPSVDSGFSTPVYNSGANQMNVGMSYLVAADTNPINPTWTLSGSSATTWAGINVVIKQSSSTPPSGSGPSVYNFAGTGQTGTAGMGGDPKSMTMQWPGPMVVLSNGDVCFDIVQNNVVACVNKQVTQETIFNVTIQPNTVAIVMGVNSLSTVGCTAPGSQGTVTQLAHPYGIDADTSDNLYVVRQQCNDVLELSHSTGVTSLIAGGNGNQYPGGCGNFKTAGYIVNVPATQSAINCPQGIAVDKQHTPAQYLMIADSGNYRYDVVNLDQSNPHSLFGYTNVPAGYIETVVGTGSRGCTPTTTNVPGLSYETVIPIGGALDTNGNFYGVSPTCSLVMKVSPAGVVNVLMGQVDTLGFGGVGGACTGTTLYYPYTASTDPVTNDVYTFDSFNNVVWMCSASTGNATIVAGNHSVFGTGQGGGGSTGIGGYATLGALFYPTAGAVISSTHFYVSLLRDNKILEIITAPVTTYTLTIAGSGTGKGAVTSGDSVINCTVTAGATSGACAEAGIASGTNVVLTAPFQPGMVFNGFSGGGCSTSPCTVNVTGNTTVTAAFGIGSQSVGLSFAGMSIQ
jgi:hypothetical protein